MKQLTIRKVSSELAMALGSKSQLKGQSINRTVLDLLHQALGLSLKGGFDNGLGKLAGTWAEDEFLEFEMTVMPYDSEPTFD